MPVSTTATNGMDVQIPVRRRFFPLSRLAMRLLIAFIVSWLIVLAFFVSGAVSH
ncbi:MAG TPA: hypothetical protein VKR83_01745 [Ktedonobacteraceae bacterium]|nr:hypothetical protein [Ktedonobacteraceae bacterium]